MNLIPFILFTLFFQTAKIKTEGFGESEMTLWSPTQADNYTFMHSIPPFKER